MAKARGRPAKQEGARRKTKYAYNNYRRGLQKVLKQVHPNTRISSRSMSMLNEIILDLHQRLCSEASVINTTNKHDFLGLRTVQTAVKLMLPGELAKHACSEGDKAVANWNKSRQ